MLPELSLNILDIAENSTRAHASLIEIAITVDTTADILTTEIKDNGYGMTPEQLLQSSNPTFTSRKSRNIGLGIPLFKCEAEMAGGTFTIDSQVHIGTTVRASFSLSHTDRLPMGDISSTIHNLIVYHPETDFLYRYTYNHKSFALDTREFKEILGDIPFDTPEISHYIKNYLEENKLEVDQNALY